MLDLGLLGHAQDWRIQFPSLAYPFIKELQTACTPLLYHILEKHSRTNFVRPFLLYLPVGLGTCCRSLPRVIQADPPVFLLHPLSTSQLSLIYKPHEVPGQRRCGTVLSTVTCIQTCPRLTVQIFFQALSRLAHPLLTVGPCLHHFLFHG